MAISHAQPGEMIDVLPEGADLKDMQTTTLIKTDALEVIRLVLPAGKEIKPHSVPGEVTVQCLAGKVALDVGELHCPLSAGKLVYLAGEDEHSLRAIEDSSLLVSILLK